VMSGVSKSFGKHAVLKGLEWTIKRGSVVGLVGRNGAGKSTLLQCALGLSDIDEGSILVLGDRVPALSRATCGRIGYVPQSSDLFGWLTARQLLDYFQAFYPRWSAAKVSALLDRWNVPLDRVISKFSGGEQQRLSIIRALAHEPDLLVLDEPVAGMDPAGRRDFLRELMSDVVDRETTVVFSTHILSDLERIAVDVAFLKEGNISLQASLDDLMEKYRRLTASPQIIDALSMPVFGRQRVSDDLDSVIVRVDGQELEQTRAQGHAVRIESLPFDDLFEEVTR